jgi:hypothetical protein
MEMDKIREHHEVLTITILEGEVLDRDKQVHALRAEMAEIQRYLEPKRHAEMIANAGPPHLAQGVNT